MAFNNNSGNPFDVVPNNPQNGLNPNGTPAAGNPYMLPPSGLNPGQYGTGQYGGMLGAMAGTPIKKAPEETSMTDVILRNPGFLAGVTGLSMLANNNGRRSVGQLFGRGALNALNALGQAGNMAFQEDKAAAANDLARAQATSQIEDRDFAHAMGLGNFDLKLQDIEKENAEMDAMMGLINEPGLLGDFGLPTGDGSGGMSGLVSTPDASGGIVMPASALPAKSQRAMGPDNRPLDKGGITNNPGNIGNTGSQVKVYGNVLQGTQAMVSLLGSKRYTENPTLRNIITTWSPPSENNTEALIAQDAKLMGVNPDDKLDLSDKKTMKNLVTAIMTNEGTLKYVPEEEIDYAVGLKPMPDGYKSRDYRTRDIALANVNRSDASKARQGTSGIPMRIMIAAAGNGPAARAARIYIAQHNRQQAEMRRQQELDLARQRMEGQKNRRMPEGVFATEMAKLDAKKLDALQQQLPAINSSIQDAQQLKATLATMKTGPMQDALDTANKVWHWAGGAGNLPGANPAMTNEQLEMLTYKNVLETLLQQKGVQTEGDADRAKKIYANIKNSPEGNNFIADYMLAVNMRKREYIQFISDFMYNGEGNYAQAEQAWAKKLEKMGSIVPAGYDGTGKPAAEKAGAAPAKPADGGQAPVKHKKALNEY